MRFASLIVGGALCAVASAAVADNGMQIVVPSLAAASYDYVQQAGSLAFDGDTVTLTDLAPATVYFSDRPFRMVGHIDNATFAGLWGPERDFALDPPNAAIATLGAPHDAPAIVELTSASLDGATLTYDVTVLSGSLPASATDVALFIDKSKGGGGPPPGPYCYHAPQDPECRGAYPPPPGPYCYHYPQAPECRAYGYLYTHPVAAQVAADVDAAAGYPYPLPAGPIPQTCHVNKHHTKMICSSPIGQVQ